MAVLFWLFNAWLIAARLRPDFSAEEALPKYAEGALWALGVLILLLHSVNLAGWPVAPGALFYLAGLVLQVAIAAFFFASLVLYRERE